MSCGLSFGEINIPSSRAFWDDCEEDEPVDGSFEKLSLKYEEGQSDTPIESDILLVIEGINLDEFVEKTLLMNAIKVCKISEKSSAIYYVPKEKLLVAYIKEDLTISGEVTELLLPYVTASKQTCTINVKKLIEYKTLNADSIADEITFIRKIGSGLLDIKELETPNFIAGVAAGVSSFCDNSKKPIGCYIIYTDNEKLDCLSAQPIIELLKKLKVKCADTFIPTYKSDSFLYN